MTARSALEESLRPYESVVVAWSGGADSSLLAWMAREVLGQDSALAVTAVSASLAPEELTDCGALAVEWGLEWATVETNELTDPTYRANGADRCARCKTSLMDALLPIATSRGATVLLGVNVDDLSDHRPGQVAAAARGARFPMVEAGLSKADVRALSRELGLRTADKPAAACLASRVAYGTPVTLGVLQSVALAESALHRLGFMELRVRHHGEVARVEVPVPTMERALDLSSEIVEAVKASGYTFVTLDLEGLRSGSMNALLVGEGRTT